MTATPDSADDSEAQFRDLALVHGYTTSVQAAAARLYREPTSPSVSTDLRLLLGTPSQLALSALERLQESNRRHGLTVIEGGTDTDDEEH